MLNFMPTVARDDSIFYHLEAVLHYLASQISVFRSHGKYSTEARLVSKVPHGTEGICCKACILHKDLQIN